MDGISSYIPRLQTAFLPLFWILSTLNIVFPVTAKLRSLLHYNQKPPPSSSTLSFSISSKRTWQLFYLHGTLLTTILLIVNQYSRFRSNNALALTAFQFQTARRLLESLFVTRFGSKRTLGLHVLFSSMIYYTAAPLGLYPYPSALPVSPRIQYIGLVVFMLASVGQWRTHVTLANVKGLGGKWGKYGVPRGGIFEYVASPHYFWEIIIYLALVLLSGFRPAVVLNWIFVICLLCLTGKRNWEWYRSTFPKEKLPPHQKYAVIPFVF